MSPAWLSGPGAAAALHQAVLFTHVIAFAITLSAVLREDLRWLRRGHIERAKLLHTQRTVATGLGVLWPSGLALVLLAIAASPGPWAPSAKLCAKLVVVSVLTLNGWALHAWVFPRLVGDAAGTAGSAGPAAVGRLGLALGAISSASWFFAAFVGVARPLAPVLSFAGFMALYALGLLVAAVLVVASRRPRLATAP